MTRILVETFADWRAQARHCLAAGISPERLLWEDRHSRQPSLPAFETADPQGLTSPDVTATPGSKSSRRVPRRFLELARTASDHRDPSRWAVLYRLLWRLTHGGEGLLDVATDDDVLAVERMAAQVRRDEHKMHAFVRFTKVAEDSGERYVAYYEPDHRIVRRAAPFFAERFSGIRWSILTPIESVHWDGETLAYTTGVVQVGSQPDSDIEALWRTYYSAVFNPARANLAATLREMPLRRWLRLPEASEIPKLLNTAHEKTVALAKSATARSARSFVPEARDLPTLREAAHACRGCDLHARATQVVFGEGPSRAPLVLVGEQPGDGEDLSGHPFVGPAGQVLDRALAAAGIDRSHVYVTNAVKHFSFEERGKRRIHKTPRYSEIRACRPWLEAELQSIRPRCVVCLGATAANALLGPQTRVLQARGRIIEDTAWASALIVTLHPSAVLRADDGETYFKMIVEDLSMARQRLTP